jgi:hypothetical protein
LSQVYALLDELRGEVLPGKGVPNADHFRGYHPKAYNKQPTRELLDLETARLCSLLERTDVTRYSLELQMWWRDHQWADRMREEREEAEADLEKTRKGAIEKLTPEERSALGLKSEK